jgi:NAD(P)-dependent dehydrogenase (short-subunit alcohol dehydrogenase family)
VLLDCAPKTSTRAEFLVSVCRTSDLGPRTAEQIAAEGAVAVALHLDVSDVGSFGAFRDTVLLTLRSIWEKSTLAGLVNKDGHGLVKPIEAVTEAQFDGLMNVHLKGPFFLTQALLPVMEGGASIVNMTSATTRVATSGVAPYAAFKGGLEVLTRYFAKKFEDRRIRANAVSPGAIRAQHGGGLSGEFETLLASEPAFRESGRGG